MNRQHGFTLIEIIAVLVILGILAAVAIPKYQDLQNSAEKKGNIGAIASMQSAATMAYSKYLLDNNGVLPLAADVNTALGATCGLSTQTDFTVACGAGGNGLTFSAYRAAGNSANSATGGWSLP